MQRSLSDNSLPIIIQRCKEVCRTIRCLSSYWHYQPCQLHDSDHLRLDWAGSTGCNFQSRWQWHFAVAGQSSGWAQGSDDWSDCCKDSSKLHCEEAPRPKVIQERMRQGRWQPYSWQLEKCDESRAVVFGTINHHLRIDGVEDEFRFDVICQQQEIDIFKRNWNDLPDPHNLSTSISSNLMAEHFHVYIGCCNGGLNNLGHRD